MIFMINRMMAELEKEHVRINIYAEFLEFNKCQVVNHCCIIYKIYKDDQFKFIEKSMSLNDQKCIFIVTGSIKTLVPNRYTIYNKYFSFSEKMMHSILIIPHTIMLAHICTPPTICKQWFYHCTP